MKDMRAVDSDTAGSILNVPDPQSFNDPSALEVKSNLQSQQYQNFIHTLYRHDKDNLKRVDNLFAKATDRSSSSATYGDDVNSPESQQPSYADYIRTQDQQPSYADYIRTQPNNFIGISQDSTSKRLKRSAQGAIFRPLFVYRIFQERQIEREEKRLRRRLQANRRRAPNYLKNEFEYQANRHNNWPIDTPKPNN